MMASPIRAIYEKGMLRPLEPVDLAEGQEIALVILTERERAIAALGDRVAKFPPADDDEEIDEEALYREIDEAYKGPPISEAIIEERREGP
jgi:predicted DNA-binding antitoxin AbrB/MazE fold protein